MATGTYKGVTIKPGTDADVAAQVRQIDMPTTGTPYAVPTTPVPAPKLSSATPTYPPPVTSTAAQARLGGLTGAMMEQMTATPTEPLAPAPIAPQANSLQSTLTSILGLNQQLGTKGERTLDIQEEEQVFQKKAAARDLENQYIARSRAYDKQADVIRKNAKGLVDGGVEERLNQNERLKQSELADIAIQQKVAIEDYQGAFEIAEAKVKAEFEPIQAQIETLKSYYQLAQNDMTESEKLKAQEAIQLKQDEKDFAQAKELAKYQADIEQSSPLYKAQVSNLYSQIDARNAEANSGAVADLSALKILSPADAKASLGAILATQKLPPVQRNQISKGIAVLNKVETIYKQGADGKFEGASPARGLLAAAGKFLPGQFATPQKTKDFEASVADTRQALINYITGAAYTSLQAEDVKNYIPSTWNTDKANQARLEGLTNSIMGDIEASLIAGGVNTALPRVEAGGLFNAAAEGLDTDLVEQAKAEGLVQ